MGTTKNVFKNITLFVKKILGLEKIRTSFLSFLFETSALLILYSFSEGLPLFCIPSAWAAATFIYCITFYLSTIFFDTNRIPITTGLSFGLLITTFTYLIIFTSLDDGGIGLFIIGLPFTILVFHILARTMRKTFVKTKTITKYCFFIPIMVGFVTVFIAGQEYKKAAATVAKTPIEQYENLPHDFMTEHIVGMHFKYHTKVCIYDGWRPPIHEPLLIMGLWMNGMEDPLQVSSLRERVELYSKLYPNKPYKMKCGCGMKGSYLYDDLWNDLPPVK